MDKLDIISELTGSDGSTVRISSSKDGGSSLVVKKEPNAIEVTLRMRLGNGAPEFFNEFEQLINKYFNK